MNETATTAPDSTAAAEAAKPHKEEGSFWIFLLKLLAIVLFFRIFIFAPFSIPSESMLPRLWNGDQLIASKWSYGYTKYSVPLNLPLIPGRIFGSQPERGDVAIFKHPVDKTDYIKRVIGLPGDQLQVKAGVVFINGAPVPKQQVEDFVIPASPNTDCKLAQFNATAADGSAECHYPQYRETLPNGVSYNVLDFGMGDADNTPVYTVPEGHLFMMGDNRDNSMDSRFPAVAGQGVGYVPQENLVGKARVMMWSTDGGAEWIKPWTWFTAARWSRIGDGI